VKKPDSQPIKLGYSSLDSVITARAQICTDRSDALDNMLDRRDWKPDASILDCIVADQLLSPISMDCGENRREIGSQERCQNI
jgi:hypothetical protein